MSDSDTLQYRAYVRLLNEQVKVKAGGKESVIFPVSKNIPSDLLNIVSTNFTLLNSFNATVASGAGAVLGTMIATYQIDATALAVGSYKLVGAMTLSNGDIIKSSIQVEVINA
jgi:hypothetical protein